MENLFTANKLVGGELVTGYYVFSRGLHYILEPYNDSGYDERWETYEWILVDGKTLKNERVDQLENALIEIKDNLLTNHKKNNHWYNLAYNALKK